MDHQNQAHFCNHPGEDNGEPPQRPPYMPQQQQQWDLSSGLDLTVGGDNWDRVS